MYQLSYHLSEIIIIALISFSLFTPTLIAVTTAFFITFCLMFFLLWHWEWEKEIRAR